VVNPFAFCLWEESSSDLPRSSNASHTDMNSFAAQGQIEEVFVGERKGDFFYTKFDRVPIV